ncbi:MAG: carbohydrate-binding family 9-like protein [Mobilitalea sp.]
MIGGINIYCVKNIQTIEQLKDCPVFRIDHHQWIKDSMPLAYGKMALLGNSEIVVSMTAVEANPLRRYTENEDPVYKDSGLEAFFNFNPSMSKAYFNFEMNANGALLSGYGENRSRKTVSQVSAWPAVCKAEIEEHSWSVLLHVPMELICEVYQREPLKTGDTFTCNFFKISEDPSIEHYVSYMPVQSEFPNFHVPESFGDAIIC